MERKTSMLKFIATKTDQDKENANDAYISLMRGISVPDSRMKYFTVNILKNIAKKHGLPVSGKKIDLWKRVNDISDISNEHEEESSDEEYDSDKEFIDNSNYIQDDIDDLPPLPKIQLDLTATDDEALIKAFQRKYGYK